MSLAFGGWDNEHERRWSGDWGDEGIGLEAGMKDVGADGISWHESRDISISNPGQ